MRNARVAGQALSLATPSARTPYICRACLLQTSRQFSTSPSLSASSEPFYKRIQSTLFGSKESKAAEEHREAAKKKQLEEIKAAGASGEVKKEKVELRNGKVFEVAEVVDPSTHQDYVVSRNWRGMERVGGEEWVRRRADSGEKYVGFMPPTRMKLEKADWGLLLRNVTAEVLALKRAGRDVLQVCNARTRIADVEEGQSGNKDRAFLAGISETSQEEHEPEALGMELEQALTSAAGGILPMGFKLDDPRIKFAILKRTMQLTGKRIPDMLLSEAKTLTHLHAAFATKEAPKKLFETDQLQDLSDVSNIQVHESRRTHVHKDKALGRWKLIEEEMSARNMPTRGESSVVGRDA